MSEQARVPFGCTLSRPGLNATVAPRMAFLRGLSRPPISAPIPANGLLWACRITQRVLRVGSTRRKRQPGLAG